MKNSILNKQFAFSQDSASFFFKYYIQTNSPVNSDWDILISKNGYIHIQKFESNADVHFILFDILSLIVYLISNTLKQV